MDILPPIEMEKQIDDNGVVETITKEEEEEDHHEEVFIDKKKDKTYTHLAKAREKALEVRRAKAKIRNEEKEKKRADKEKKKAETLERRREKARERYWKKKLDKEIEQEQEMKKKEVEQKEVEQKEVKPQNSSISYEQFEQYMDKYKSKRNQHKSDEKPADYPKLKSRKNHHNFF